MKLWEGGLLQNKSGGQIFLHGSLTRAIQALCFLQTIRNTVSLWIGAVSVASLKKDYWGPNWQSPVQVGGQQPKPWSKEIVSLGGPACPKRGSISL